MVVASVCFLFAVAGGRASAELEPPVSLAEPDLARALWAHSPLLAAARRDLIEAEAVSGRARLYPNPTLSGSWATIPIGPRNPPGQPFWDVPNYNAAIGETFELGKRGPRRRAADASATASRFDLADAYRQSFFALLGTLVDQAEAVERGSILRRLVESGLESLRLQRARAERGDVAAIDVERLEVEYGRRQASVREADAAAVSALGRCGAILGIPCPRIAEEATARQFLDRARAALKFDPGVVQARADLQALGARATQADADRLLAERRVIPDPAVTLGVQHDAFVAAGNQANSVSVGVAIPLPVFDRGQVDAARARRVRRNVDDERAALAAGAADTIAQGQRRIRSLSEQVRVLEEEVIPRARLVVERMEAAARRGGAALPDVLLARRALEELQLDLSGAGAERYRAVLEVRRAAGLLPPAPDGSSR